MYPALPRNLVLDSGSLEDLTVVFDGIAGTLICRILLGAEVDLNGMTVFLCLNEPSLRLPSADSDKGFDQPD